MILTVQNIHAIRACKINWSETSRPLIFRICPLNFALTVVRRLMQIWNLLSNIGKQAIFSNNKITCLPLILFRQNNLNKFHLNDRTNQRTLHFMVIINLRKFCVKLLSGPAENTVPLALVYPLILRIFMPWA